MAENVDQISTGLRSILNSPVFYRLFQNLVGARKSRRILNRDFLQDLTPTSKILDIGCGDAEILDFLPHGIHYVGFDLSKKYIEFAKKKYKEQGHFFCQRVGDFNVEDIGQFDVVLAIGILHHINDDEAGELFKIARSKLKIGGRLITMDGTYVANQPFLSRYVISKDRGQHIRTPESYMKLAKKVFYNAKGVIRTDMINIPYTTYLMTCLRE